MKLVNVKVPATSANLGPGYDCLGLALGLYNEFDFIPLPEGSDLEIIIEGEGADIIPRDASNLIVQAAQFLCDHLQRPLPPMRLIQRNYVPPASGMGSSSTAVVAGMLGVNEILKAGLTKNDILELATQMEGHPDNVAPALFGGLVLVPMGVTPLHIERFEVPPLIVTIILPDFDLLTQDARAALPAQVSREDAIFNLARTPLVIRALEQGNYATLRIAMQDRLHQPYRLPLVPGLGEAYTAVLNTGAAAVALSGAGPSLIAFAPQNHMAIGRAGQAAFKEAGLDSRFWLLPIDHQGSQLRIVH